MTSFYFNDTATSPIYTLSLHDALPICPDGVDDRARGQEEERLEQAVRDQVEERRLRRRGADRKSTRLNSSHQIISYAVFCLKKKTNPRLLKRYSANESSRPSPHPKSRH